MHDDVRHIDWNVTARLQTPYVRQFTEDRELTAWFLLDLSGSVDFGSDERHQAAVSDRLRRACWRACSRATATASARCSTATRVDTVLPPRAGRTHVLNLLQRMRKRRRRPRRSRRGARRHARRAGRSAERRPTR